MQQKRTLTQKKFPRNQRPNVGPRQADAGTGVPSFEPIFTEKTYKTTKMRHKQFLTKMKKLMKKGNKKQFKTDKIHQQFLSTYKKYFELEESKTDRSYLQTATNVMLNQMSTKRGIELFKERAIAEMYKEFNQLDKGDMSNKPVVLPQDPTKLTRTENREAMEAVNLIK